MLNMLRDLDMSTFISPNFQTTTWFRTYEIHYINPAASHAFSPPILNQLIWLIKRGFLI